MLPPRFHNTVCLLIAAAGFILALFIAIGDTAHG